MKIKHLTVLSLCLVCLESTAQEFSVNQSYEDFRDKCIDQSDIDLVTGFISFFRNSSLLDHCGIEPWRKSNRRVLDLTYVNDQLADLNFRSEISLESDSYGFGLTRNVNQSSSFWIDGLISKDILQGLELRNGTTDFPEGLEYLDGYRNEGSLID